MPSQPKQTYNYHLNVSKGWPHPAACDFVAKVSANVLYDLRAGQCCHLNSSGQLEPGVQLAQMPLFIFQGVGEHDTLNATGDQWVPVTPSGNIMCIPGKAAVELETTEFVPGLTYAPNDLLKSITGNSANAEALSGGRPTASSSGVLTNASVTLYTTAVVGVVSRGLFTNYNKVQMLAFWPLYLPGTV